MKFECWSCGNTFNADETKDVFCPKCHSENVEYARFHMPKYTKWVVLALLFIAVGLYIIPNYIGDFTTVDMPDSPKKAEELRLDSIIRDETGLEIPAEIELGELIFEDDGYSIEVSIKNASNISRKFVIRDAFSEKIISESSDGKFSNVPFSNAEGGSYRIQAIATAKDSVLAEKVCVGFIKQRKVERKMTKEELQTKISSRDKSLMGIGENDYLSPDVKLVFSGLPADAVNIPSVLSEVFEKLDMGTWSSISVQEIEYDDMNRISKIKFGVTEAIDF